MDDISHLDFDSPPTPAIVWDEFGMPTPDGDGRRLWAATLAELNREADHEGWDAPHKAWLVSSPRRQVQALDDLGLRIDDVVEHIAPEAGDAPVIVGMGTVLVGELDTANGGDLWGQVVPVDFDAVILRQEAWANFPVPDRPSGKKPTKARPPSSAAPLSERTEIRIWVVATRSGHVFSTTYRRKGKRKSAVVETTETVRGLIPSLLARSLGVTRPPEPDATPISPREAAALWVAHRLSQLLLSGRDDTDSVRGIFAAALMSVGDPIVACDPALAAHLVAVTADAPLGPNNELVLQSGPIASTYAAADQATWVEAIVNGPTSSLLLRDLPVPRTEANAQWAGEPLLQLLAGWHYAPLIATLRDQLTSLTPDHRQRIDTLLLEARLSLPAAVSA